MTKLTMAQQEAVEKELEKYMCPKLRDVLKWMQIMKLTGNTATDYKHFLWCFSEIIQLRKRIAILELIVGGTSDAT